MAKLKDFSKLIASEANKILEELSKPEFVDSVGRQLADGIKKRTKLGYGVSEQGGQQVKLKPLSESYRDTRKRTGVDSSTSPAKSNLTNTGAMLNDIKNKSEGTKISLYMGTEESAKKVEWNKDGGRVFFNVSKVQMNQLISLLKTKIRDILGN